MYEKLKAGATMRFSAGYNLLLADSLVDAVISNKEHISEVYFSHGDFPNGRNLLSNTPGYSKEEAEEKQSRDLRVLSENGVGLNLLLNGNCYGKNALAREFYNKIGDTVDELAEAYGLSAVTTTSPLIARFIKENFRGIEVRASVNMEIGTLEGLDYLKDNFDSFYLKREYNRDLSRIKAARNWCDQNGKGLYGLANSGCLNFCSAHVFHDNIVAHEAEIAEMDNGYDFKGQCHSYLENPEKREEWLRITNFIRPEDVYLYEGLFDGLKLATRVSRAAPTIVRAYCGGSFSGPLHTLLEPNHGGIFGGAVVENINIPRGFAERVLNCDKNCTQCGFCKEAQQKATVNL